MVTQNASSSSILRPGRNCWRIERARRAALLIDGEAYFTALRRAARRAERSLFIIGWDVDSRIEFPPGGEDDGLPRTLGAFLDALVTRNEQLDIYVLDWDFAMLFALDREVLPIYSLGWRTHKRLRFHLDDRHPPGGSHHQKIVVIDDALAFVGGMDLTKGRWDTPQHAPEEPRRRAPDGEPCGPNHDAMLMVEGKIAAAVGELARERWRRATGRRVPAIKAPESSPWPDGVAPDFEDVDVAIARTEPGYDGHPPVCEVRELHLDAIAAARRSLYVENQYLTSPLIGKALAARLVEHDGPGVVVVTRRTGSGWLENNTMIALRARLVRGLAQEDRFDRLRVYYADHIQLADRPITVHTKLVVVDDRLLRVGSANLNNRSLSLDSECDLAIEAKTAREREAVSALRNRLLAEHLGVRPHEVAQAIESHQGSIVRAVESLRGNERTLTPVPTELDPEIEALAPVADALDLEKPIDPADLVDEFVPPEHQPLIGKRLAWASGLLLAVAAFAAAWRWGSMRDWLDPDTLATLHEAVAGLAWSPLWVLGAYAVASLVMFPITLLIAITAFVFGPWTAFAYAFAGCLLGAALTFAFGRALGRNAVRRLAGNRLNALSKRLSDGRVLSVAALRLLPIAPFTVVNLVAGASRLHARDFLLGTALGMSPGILAISFFADRLAAAVQRPAPDTWALLSLVLILVLLCGLGLRWWIRRRIVRHATAPR